jgi:Tfp pilus assembly protein PilZ
VNLITAKYRSGAEFLRAYQSDSLHGGIFIPTRKRVALGTPVVVDIRFRELGNRILLRGVVAWRRAMQRRTKLRAGLGVEFLASEQKKRDFLIGVADGEIVDIVQRRHRRLPVEVRVDWRDRSSSGWNISNIEDIGEGGAFIRTTSFRPVGSTVLLEVSVPGAQRTTSIEGVVAWTCHTPGQEGMGVEFRCRDLGGKRRLKELVRRLERFGRQLELTVAG